MKAMWHPLSAVFVPDPPMWATRIVLTMMLREGNPIEVLYAGDRMGSTLPHGTRVRVAPRHGTTLGRGDVVLSVAGPPDLLRVETVEDGGVRVVADADPSAPERIRREDITAVAELRRRPSPRWVRAGRRWLLDLREAWSGRPDAGGDPSATVRSKYAAQAAFYASSEDHPLPEAVLDRIRRSVMPGGTLLVAGSGTGREAVQLAKAGYRVRGVDFAAEMVERAVALARTAGAAVEFVTEDLSRHREKNGSIDAVFFTYDVYSFLAGAARRVETLRRVRDWLRPGGVVFLSARRVHGFRERVMLAISWLARGGSGPFGDSHTRWIDPSGGLRRSYVHVFSAGRLAREVRAAGFRSGPWEGGHVELRATEEPA